MKQIQFFIILALLLPVLSSAQDFDGSKPLACAIIEVNECAPGSGCIKGISSDFNFPQFIKINFAKKTLVGTFKNEKLLSAPIDKVITQDGNLILHGNQNGRAWNMVISQSTGHMTGTVAANDFSFTIFGACIVR